MTTEQIAVNEKMIRVNSSEYWLYGAVDPKTNEIIHFSLFPSTMEQTARWFLAELHQRCHLGDIEFLVNGANYLGSVLDEGGHRS